MLGKLLKHEFIATGRIMGALYAVVAVIMAYVLGSYYISKDTATTGQMLGITVLLLISSCSFILTAVVMIVNFQRSLYGEQGYLSFTLPVKGSTLLFSKIIASTVWFVAAFLCLMGSAAITYFVVKEDVIGDETFSTIESLLPMFLQGKSISTIVTSIVISMISYFLRFAVITLEMYFAISLAKTRHFQKRYLLWTIIFTIVILFAVEKISGVISDNITFGLSIVGNELSVITNYDDLATGASFTDLVSIITYLIFGVGLYYATFYVMNKKVNIR
ncbi:MAG TPA: hypothetical protein DIW36_04790 [Ruminococcaceae bacterium]|nr:hypothetical protein [Oscillospiraceae bacterium]